MRLKYPVVLASASPRRQQLLKGLMQDFAVAPADVDEAALTSADPWVTAQTLAREKALAVFSMHPDRLVIAGDTVVALPVGEGYVQLAKPDDASAATAMMEALAGKEHVVITGVALRWPKGFHAFTDTTRVTFRALKPAEIAEYVATGEGRDKAGGYAIQGGAAKFVARMEGSLTNVVGLPMEALEEALKQVN